MLAVAMLTSLLGLAASNRTASVITQHQTSAGYFLLAAKVVGQQTNMSFEQDCPSLEVLDFLKFNLENATEVNKLEEIWPCETRIYWLHIQGLVSLVRFLFEYATIALVVFGLMVNTISLCVLNSPPMNTTSVSVYLRAIAISDIGALLFNITVGILRAHSKTVNSFYMNNTWMCFIQNILRVIFMYYSTWLVVALTFERLLIIKSLFKSPRWCTLQPSTCMIIIIGCLSLIAALIRSQITGFEKDNMYGYVPCGASMKSKWSNALVPFLILTTFIPTILIFIANICLLLFIRRSAQDHSNLNAANTEEGPSMMRATRMLLVISMSYLVLLLPVGIVGCIELYFKTHQQTQPETGALNEQSYIKKQQQMLLIKWIRGLCYFFFLLNFNINFFLYCVSGKQFRETVKVCLQRWLPSFCWCLCLKMKTKLPNSPRKHPGLVTSLSNLTLQQSDTNSERRTSNCSTNSEHAHDNSAFENKERSIQINHFPTVAQTKL